MTTTTRLQVLATCLALAAVGQSANAALINASYLRSADLAAKRRFNSVVHLEVGGSAKYASAVMLTPTIGITAASALAPQNLNSVTVNGPNGSQELTRDRWVLHDDFQTSLGLGGSSDLAMFSLANPIDGLNYARVRRKGGEEGKTMTYVGHLRGGYVGDLPGPAGARIAFKNKIDGDPTGTHFTVDFDERYERPHKYAGEVKSVYGDAKVLKNEGVLHSKEFGGAAFVKTKKGKWRLAGIGSFASHAASATHGLQVNQTAGFTRLSLFTDWISERSDENWWDEYLHSTTRSRAFADIELTTTTPSIDLAPPPDSLVESNLAVPEPASATIAILAAALLGGVRMTRHPMWERRLR